MNPALAGSSTLLLRSLGHEEEITIELPDDVAQRPNPGRKAREVLAIEGYRSGVLTHHEASQLLQFSRFEFDAFLKARHIYDHAYDIEDFEQALETLKQLQASGYLRRP